MRTNLNVVFTLALISVLFGCTSPPKPESAVARGQKVHYITVPPQTGSYVTRRIAVYDDGTPVNPADASAVQNMSPASLDRIRPTSNSPGGGR